jgi:hypothetical protein
MKENMILSAYITNGEDYKFLEILIGHIWNLVIEQIFCSSLIHAPRIENDTSNNISREYTYTEPLYPNDREW